VSILSGVDFGLELNRALARTRVGGFGVAAFWVLGRLGGNMVTASTANQPFDWCFAEEGLVGPVTSKKCIDRRVGTADWMADVGRNLGLYRSVECRVLPSWGAPARACAAT
jgi:hypothetical protein